MVIDTSALIAILRREPEADALASAIEADRTRMISAVTWLEAGAAVLERFGPQAASDLDALLAIIAPAVVPFDRQQAEIALEAFARFGRGRHSASLDFGDCAAYALAVSEAEPLLFKGTDFAATGVDAALAV